MQTTSIQDYHRRFPHSAGSPSITQSGGLAGALHRIELRRQRRERRQESLRNFARLLRRGSQSLYQRLKPNPASPRQLAPVRFSTNLPRHY
jgi:hypothetical protein